MRYTTNEDSNLLSQGDVFKYKIERILREKEEEYIKQK